MNCSVTLSPISLQTPVMATPDLVPHRGSDIVHANTHVVDREHSPTHRAPPPFSGADCAETNLGISPALLDGSPSAAQSPEPEISASGGLVYGAMGEASAWWTPIQASDAVELPPKLPTVTRHSKRITTQADVPARRDNSDASVEMVTMSNRPRLRKVDEKGQLVWPFELETVLIAGMRFSLVLEHSILTSTIEVRKLTDSTGLRKYHATSCRPRPSASRNFNRNKLVAEYIESMTGIKRSTKQIASRIQVLRDAWKGKKEFSLVAQPRELSEMGYLPPFDGQTQVRSPHPEATEERTGPGPIRNVRRTRRSQRGDNRSRDDINEDEVNHLSDVREGSVRGSRPPLRSRSKSQPPMAPISFDPYQLDKLGSPKTSLENLLPPSTLFFVKNTLRKERGVTILLAKCTLSSLGGKDPEKIASEIRMNVEIGPESINQRIESFRESAARREKLGTQVQLLQSSIIWDEETDLGHDAGLVERISGFGEEEETPARSPHRYALELQLEARQALTSGLRPVIVVQNLSLLRVTDSRVLDSWVIIWVVETSPKKQTLLELLPISDVPDVPQRPAARRRPASPVESEMLSEPPSPMPPVDMPSGFTGSPLSGESFSRDREHSPAVASPQDSGSSAPSPMVSLHLEPEPIMHAASGCTPLPLTVTPRMTEMMDDGAAFIPLPVEDADCHLGGDVYMRTTFSRSQARLDVSEPMSIEFPIIHQEPPTYHNYQAALEISAPPSPIASYPVIQHPSPRAHHSYQRSQVVTPDRATVMIRDSARRVLNLQSSLPLHHQQMHNNTSPIVPDEWQHAGHDHLVQGEVGFRYDSPSTYQPVYIQHMEPPLHHIVQPSYLQEVVHDSVVSPPTSASAVSSSSQVQYHMAHSHPLVDHGWYPVGSPQCGVSPGPSRRFSETPIWTADPYHNHGASFSSERCASVPPVVDASHSPFHPVQYVYVNDAFNGNESMAPNPYITEDISGYRFPASPERTRSQDPNYYIPPHMMVPVDSSLYGVYQY